MIIDGEQFTNSATCHGRSFAISDVPLDLAEITIRGRYPETGWARNKESHEIVRILRGAGNLAIRGKETIALAEGVVVHVPPNERFVWQSEAGKEMTILMACSPPFNAYQYEIEEENYEV